MSYIATENVKVARGQAEDEYGDPSTVAGPPSDARPLPVSIIEKRRVIVDQDTGQARTIRYGVGRARAHYDIREGDRLHSLRTGKVWLVDEVTPNHTIAGMNEVVLDLRDTKGE